jgi:pimeloyl-ACP methyl ester carboxylesterase
MEGFNMRVLITLLMLAALCIAGPAGSQAPAKIGVVTMHGKSGSPNRFIYDLASTLGRNEMLVANLEMPWSGKRHYDADVAAAEKQVQDALDGLRAKGATKLFVAGHSFGGTFAFYLGGRLPVDGVIAIAPGGAADALVTRRELADSLERARKYVAEGKGSQRVELSDYEGSRGHYPIMTVPAAFVSWFDPEGAMNQTKALRALKPDMPVLYVVPTDDYPGLLKARPRISGMLPRNAHSRTYEPASDHLNAPRNSADEIVKWVRQVAG